MLTSHRAQNTHLGVAAIAALVAAFAVGGCTSDSRPSPAQSVSQSVSAPNAERTAAAGGKAVCAFLSKVNDAAAKKGSQAQGLALLSSFAGQFTAELRSAPAAMKPDLQVVFTAAQAALAHKQLSYLASDTVAAAGARLAAVCA